MHTTRMHMHMHITHMSAIKFVVTALYSSVKQYYSKVIAHTRLTSFRGHGQQQCFYVSQLQHKDLWCLSFLAHSSILPL